MPESVEWGQPGMTTSRMYQLARTISPGQVIIRRVELPDDQEMIEQHLITTAYLFPEGYFVGGPEMERFTVQLRHQDGTERFEWEDTVEVRA